MMDAFAGYDGFILDAGDISTLNQVSTGTTPVTAVNDPIGLMLEKSGNGNNPLQATGPARPSWQVDANGYHYAQLLGTDDSLSCATGGGGSTGFLFCCALKPTGGVGTYRIIYSDIGVNTGYNVRIGTGNNLVIGAGNGSAFTTKATTATADVGTTNYFTAWDDGTNLSVQIDGGAVASVARPVVVAGPGSFSLFKENDGPTGFNICDFYRAVYIKNWSGTAAQLAAIQSWVKAGAGI